MQVQHAWMKRGIWDAVIGSVLTMIGASSETEVAAAHHLALRRRREGWTTSNTANQVAIQRADAAVTTAFVPICLAQEKVDVRQATGVPAIDERPEIAPPIPRADHERGIPARP